MVHMGVQLLRSARADYDTITIRPEVNGHVEPLTDPHYAITYLCWRLADWNQILVVVVLGFLPIPNAVAISCGWYVVLYKVYL